MSVVGRMMSRPTDDFSCCARPNRSVENWSFLKDIFSKGRLYAAAFRTRNDPMEGLLYEHDKDVSLKYRKAIRNASGRLNICSLCDSDNNTLLWSYYASGGILEPRERIPRVHNAALCAGRDCGRRARLQRFTQDCQRRARPDRTTSSSDEGQAPPSQ